MLPLGPILAQLVTLGVGARTEGRYIVSADTHYEAGTRPLVDLGLGWRHLSLTLDYSPAITVIPLESAPRDLILFHTGFLNARYAWGRLQLTASEFGGYGTQNFRVLALTDNRTGVPTTGTGAVGGANPGAGASAPATPGSTGTGTVMNGAGTQIRATNQDIRFASTTTTVGVTDQIKSTVSVHGDVSYTVAGATRAEDRTQYPLVKGPRFLASTRYRISRSDDLSASASAQYASASTGTSTWVGTLGATWGHRLDAGTTTVLGAGISGSRSPLILGFVAYTIYPTFNAGISNSSKLARGTLSLTFATSAAPVIDLVTAVADPRLGLNAIVGWKRDRFSTTVSCDSALSLANPSNRGALSAAGAAAGVAYQIGKALSVDGGVRVAYQTFQGQTVIPLTYAAFLGVTFGLQQRL